MKTALLLMIFVAAPIAEARSLNSFLIERAALLDDPGLRSGDHLSVSAEQP